MDPQSRLTSPLIQIENGTALSGLNETAAAGLRTAGFNAVSFGTYNGKKSLERTTITVFNPKIDAKILRQIQNVFETPNLINKEPDGESYDILVILGKDYKGK